MPGKQAKILCNDQIEDLLVYAETTRWPARNRLIVLFSVKAGLRAAMMLDAFVYRRLSARSTSWRMASGRLGIGRCCARQESTASVKSLAMRTPIVGLVPVAGRPRFFGIFLS